MMSEALNFPAWDLGGMSGGLLIALISVIHVFVAQFAVGGGFFLVAAERIGHREGSQRILRWVQRHTQFFLLLTMVFGGITGVGIWLVISLVSPAGTFLLVREFVYAWAAEWVFFLAEIATLLMYAASFSRCRAGLMEPRIHMSLGAAYAVFAFLSLFIINGIVSFMLTPGDWVKTGDFWSGFFNPGFGPSLLFRTGLSLTLAGMFGLITATRIPHAETRIRMVRFCARWICLPFVLMLLGAAWYSRVLPEEVRVLMLRRTADIRPFIQMFLYAAPVLFLAGAALFVRMPHKAYTPFVAAVLLIGLMVSGSFEWVRETGRRPWLVHGYMYSNGITVADGKRINEQGLLAASGWARLRLGGEEALRGEKAKQPLSSLTPAERERFAHFMYVRQCSACHGLGGPMLDLAPRVKGRGVQGVAASLGGQGVISPYMPPFFGTDEERLALAAYLADLENKPR